MNKSLIFILITLFCFAHNGFTNEPDSAYLFAYSVNEGRNGLTLAWSIDQKNWHAIGPEHCFLFFDFGRWGTQKRMFSPFLFQDNKRLWHCIWSLNKTVQQFAHTSSENLYEWHRQSYPMVMTKGNIQNPEVSYKEDKYIIT